MMVVNKKSVPGKTTAATHGGLGSGSSPNSMASLTGRELRSRAVVGAGVSSLEEPSKVSKKISSKKPLAQSSTPATLDDDVQEHHHHNPPSQASETESPNPVGPGKKSRGLRVPTLGPIAKRLTRSDAVLSDGGGVQSNAVMNVNNDNVPVVSDNETSSEGNPTRHVSSGDVGPEPVVAAKSSFKKVGTKPASEKSPGLRGSGGGLILANLKPAALDSQASDASLEHEKRRKSLMLMKQKTPQSIIKSSEDTLDPKKTPRSVHFEDVYGEGFGDDGKTTTTASCQEPESVSISEGEVVFVAKQKNIHKTSGEKKEQQKHVVSSPEFKGRLTRGMRGRRLSKDMSSGDEGNDMDGDSNVHSNVDKLAEIGLDKSRLVIVGAENLSVKERESALELSAVDEPVNNAANESEAETLTENVNDIIAEKVASGEKRVLETGGTGTQEKVHKPVECRKIKRSSLQDAEKQVEDAQERILRAEVRWGACDTASDDCSGALDDNSGWMGAGTTSKFVTKLRPEKTTRARTECPGTDLPAAGICVNVIGKKAEGYMQLPALSCEVTNEKNEREACEGPEKSCEKVVAERIMRRRKEKTPVVADSNIHTRQMVHKGQAVAEKVSSAKEGLTAHGQSAGNSTGQEVFPVASEKVMTTNENNRTGASSVGVSARLTGDEDTGIINTRTEAATAEVEEVVAERVRRSRKGKGEAMDSWAHNETLSIEKDLDQEFQASANNTKEGDPVPILSDNALLNDSNLSAEQHCLFVTESVGEMITNVEVESTTVSHPDNIGLIEKGKRKQIERSGEEGVVEAQSEERDSKIPKVLGTLTQGMKERGPLESGGTNIGEVNLSAADLREAESSEPLLNQNVDRIVGEKSPEEAGKGFGSLRNLQISIDEEMEDTEDGDLQEAFALTGKLSDIMDAIVGGSRQENFISSTQRSSDAMVELNIVRHTEKSTDVDGLGECTPEKGTSEQVADQGLNLGAECFTGKPIHGKSLGGLKSPGKNELHKQKHGKMDDGKEILSNNPINKGGNIENITSDNMRRKRGRPRKQVISSTQRSSDAVVELNIVRHTENSTDVDGLGECTPGKGTSEQVADQGLNLGAECFTGKPIHDKSSGGLKSPDKNELHKQKHGKMDDGKEILSNNPINKGGNIENITSDNMRRKRGRPRKQVISSTQRSSDAMVELNIVRHTEKSTDEDGLGECTPEKGTSEQVADQGLNLGAECFTGKPIHDTSLGGLKSPGKNELHKQQHGKMDDGKEILSNNPINKGGNIENITSDNMRRKRGRPRKEVRKQKAGDGLDVLLDEVRAEFSSVSQSAKLPSPSKNPASAFSKTLNSREPVDGVSGQVVQAEGTSGRFLRKGDGLQPLRHVWVRGDRKLLQESVLEGVPPLSGQAVQLRGKSVVSGQETVRAVDPCLAKMNTEAGSQGKSPTQTSLLRRQELVESGTKSGESTKMSKVIATETSLDENEEDFEDLCLGSSSAGKGTSFVDLLTAQTAKDVSKRRSRSNGLKKGLQELRYQDLLLHFLEDGFPRNDTLQSSLNQAGASHHSGLGGEAVQQVDDVAVVVPSGSREEISGNAGHNPAIALASGDKRDKVLSGDKRVLNSHVKLMKQKKPVSEKDVQSLQKPHKTLQTDGEAKGVTTKETCKGNTDTQGTCPLRAGAGASLNAVVVGQCEPHPAHESDLSLGRSPIQNVQNVENKGSREDEVPSSCLDVSVSKGINASVHTIGTDTVSSMNATLPVFSFRFLLEGALNATLDDPLEGRFSVQQMRQTMTQTQTQTDIQGVQAETSTHDLPQFCENLTRGSQGVEEGMSSRRQRLSFMEMVMDGAPPSTNSREMEGVSEEPGPSLVGDRDVGVASVVQCTAEEHIVGMSELRQISSDAEEPPLGRTVPDFSQSTVLSKTLEGVVDKVICGGCGEEIRADTEEGVAEDITLKSRIDVSSNKPGLEIVKAFLPKNHGLIPEDIAVQDDPGLIRSGDYSDPVPKELQPPSVEEEVVKIQTQVTPLPSPLAGQMLENSTGHFDTLEKVSSHIQNSETSEKVKQMAIDEQFGIENSPCETVGESGRDKVLSRNDVYEEESIGRKLQCPNPDGTQALSSSLEIIPVADDVQVFESFLTMEDGNQDKSFEEGSQTVESRSGSLEDQFTEENILVAEEAATAENRHASQREALLMDAVKPIDMPRSDQLEKLLPCLIRAENSADPAAYEPRIETFVEEPPVQRGDLVEQSCCVEMNSEGDRESLSPAHIVEENVKSLCTAGGLESGLSPVEEDLGQSVPMELVATLEGGPNPIHDEEMILPTEHVGMASVKEIESSAPKEVTSTISENPVVLESVSKRTETEIPVSSLRQEDTTQQPLPVCLSVSRTAVSELSGDPFAILAQADHDGSFVEAKIPETRAKLVDLEASASVDNLKDEPVGGKHKSEGFLAKSVTSSLPISIACQEGDLQPLAISCEKTGSPQNLRTQQGSLAESLIGSIDEVTENLGRDLVGIEGTEDLPVTQNTCLQKGSVADPVLVGEPRTSIPEFPEVSVGGEYHSVEMLPLKSSCEQVTPTQIQGMEEVVTEEQEVGMIDACVAGDPRCAAQHLEGIDGGSISQVPRLEAAERTSTTASPSVIEEPLITWRKNPWSDDHDVSFGGIVHTGVTPEELGQVNEGVDFEVPLEIVQGPQVEHNYGQKGSTSLVPDDGAKLAGTDVPVLGESALGPEAGATESLAENHSETIDERSNGGPTENMINGGIELDHSAVPLEEPLSKSTKSTCEEQWQNSEITASEMMGSILVTATGLGPSYTQQEVETGVQCLPEKRSTNNGDVLALDREQEHASPIVVDPMKISQSQQVVSNQGHTYKKKGRPPVQNQGTPNRARRDGAFHPDLKRKKRLQNPGGRRVRPRPIDPDQPVIIFVEGRDKRVQGYDGGALFQWLQQQDEGNHSKSPGSLLGAGNSTPVRETTSRMHSTKEKPNIAVPSFRIVADYEERQQQLEKKKQVEMGKQIGSVAYGKKVDSKRNRASDYDMDDEDEKWLHSWNQRLSQAGLQQSLSEDKFEEIIEFLERASAELSIGYPVASCQGHPATHQSPVPSLSPSILPGTSSSALGISNATSVTPGGRVAKSPVVNLPMLLSGHPPRSVRGNDLHNSGRKAKGYLSTIESISPASAIQVNTRISEIDSMLERAEAGPSGKSFEAPALKPSDDCCICNGGEDDENNPVYTCKQCLIHVHQSCYGIREKFRDDNGRVIAPPNWCCRKCEAVAVGKAESNVSCALCRKRGGALKPTVEPQRWAHVACALYTNETFFVDPDAMEPIDGIAAVEARVEKRQYRCGLCGVKKGTCSTCCVKGCGAPFHISCGVSQGASFELRHSKQRVVGVRSFCPRHAGITPLNFIPSAGRNESVMMTSSTTSGAAASATATGSISTASSMDNRDVGSTWHILSHLDRSVAERPAHGKDVSGLGTDMGGQPVGTRIGKVQQVVGREWTRGNSVSEETVTGKNAPPPERMEEGRQLSPFILKRKWGESSACKGLAGDGKEQFVESACPAGDNMGAQVGNHPQSGYQVAEPGHIPPEKRIKFKHGGGPALVHMPESSPMVAQHRDGPEFRKSSSNAGHADGAVSVDNVAGSPKGLTEDRFASEVRELLILEEAMKSDVAPPHIIREAFVYWRAKRAKHNGSLLCELQHERWSRTLGIFNKDAVEDNRATGLPESSAPTCPPGQRPRPNSSNDILDRTAEFRKQLERVRSITQLVVQREKLKHQEQLVLGNLAAVQLNIAQRDVKDRHCLWCSSTKNLLKCETCPRSFCFNCFKHRKGFGVKGWVAALKQVAYVCNFCQEMGGGVIDFPNILDPVSSLLAEDGGNATFPYGSNIVGRGKGKGKGKGKGRGKGSGRGWKGTDYTLPGLLAAAPDVVSTLSGQQEEQLYNPKTSAHGNKQPGNRFESICDSGLKAMKTNNSHSLVERMSFENTLRRMNILQSRTSGPRSQNHTHGSSDANRSRISTDAREKATENRSADAATDANASAAASASQYLLVYRKKKKSAGDMSTITNTTADREARLNSDQERFNLDPSPIDGSAGTASLDQAGGEKVIKLSELRDATTTSQPPSESSCGVELHSSSLMKGSASISNNRCNDKNNGPQL